MEGSLAVPLVLWLWATLVGLDLVSVPQIMIARPLVVGVVSGAILGDVAAGAGVGMILELYAFEALPVGAARYPDYGAATVGAALLAAGQPLEHGLGLAVALGLGLAALGEWSMPVLRQMNTRAVRRSAAALDAGSPDTIRRLQYAGLARDGARSAVLAFLAITTGVLARDLAPHAAPFAAALTVAVVGAGLASAVGGAIRTAGRTARLGWFAAGLAAGGALVVIT